MRVLTVVNGVEAEIEVDGLQERTFELLQDRLRAWLGDPVTKGRKAIARAFFFLLREAPQANASDLWCESPRSIDHKIARSPGSLIHFARVY